MRTQKHRKNNPLFTPKLSKAESNGAETTIFKLIKRFVESDRKQKTGGTEGFCGMNTGWYTDVIKPEFVM